MRMHIRPLELWIFTLVLAMAGVAAFHQYRAYERANAPPTPYQMTVKVVR